MQTVRGCGDSSEGVHPYPTLALHFRAVYLCGIPNAGGMTVATALKRKTSLTLDASALDEAREMGLNVSALADEALKEAVRKARQQRWLEENAEAFKAQSEWHEKHGHPAADIMVGPVAASWRD